MIQHARSQILSLILFFSFLALSMEEYYTKNESHEILPAYLVLANNGHIEDIEHVIVAHLKQGGYLDTNGDLIPQPDSTEKNEYFKTAVEWFARHYIRTFQDAVCYDDPKIIIHRIIHYLEFKPFFHAIKCVVAQSEEFNKIRLEQLPWAEEILEKPTMPVPSIGFYLKSPSYQEHMQEEGCPYSKGCVEDIRHLKPSNTWYTARKKVLVNFRQNLTSTSQK